MTHDDPTVPLRASPARDPLAAGMRLGRYLITARIGAGGSGTVYAAFDTLLDRKVALKVLGYGADGREPTVQPGWARLVREARMLAKLADPEVVTVFDVGELEGQPYLALEFVEGGDLSAWLEQGQRSLRQGLQLMIEAGRGLAAAHDAGLVHGDFKPANVLIDAKGRAKVGDFGIARLGSSAGPVARDDADEPPREHTDPESSESVPPTLTTSGRGRLVGTPAFMAPEQFGGHPADVRSDVYAYCTALFRMVYGALPFRGDTIAQLAARKALGEVERPPATRVPPWLDRLLDRGLAAEADARPPTMRAVLADLERGLGRPRRRTVLLAAAAGLTAAVAIAVAWPRSHPLCSGDRAGFGWDAPQRARVREAFVGSGHVDGEAVFARVDAALTEHAGRWVEAYTQTCEGVSSEADPLTERSFACLQRTRAVAAALTEAWGQADATAVERADPAIAALRPAKRCRDPAALARGFELPSDPATRVCADAARRVTDRAVAFAASGDVERALADAREGAKAADACAYEPVAAEAKLALGQALEMSGQPQAARDTLQEAFFSAQRSDHHEVAATAAQRLVFVVGTRLEDHDGGLTWVEHARVALERTGESPGRLLGNEGAILDRLGRFDDAIAVYERALAELDPADIASLGVTHLRLGDSLRASQRADEALTHYDAAIELWRAAHGADHPRIAIAQLSRATALAKLGRTDEAIPAFESAIAGMTAALGPDHPNVGAAQQNLGIALKDAGRFEAAQAAMERALEITQTRYGADHLKTAQRREALGRLLTRRGRAQAALAEHERAMRVFERELDPGHPDVLIGWMNIGDAHAAAPDPTAARKAYARALELAEANRPPGDPLITDARQRLEAMKTPP